MTIKEVQGICDNPPHPSAVCTHPKCNAPVRAMWPEDASYNGHVQALCDAGARLDACVCACVCLCVKEEGRRRPESIVVVGGCVDSQGVGGERDSTAPRLSAGDTSPDLLAAGYTRSPYLPIAMLSAVRLAAH